MNRRAPYLFALFVLVGVALVWWRGSGGTERVAAGPTPPSTEEASGEELRQELREAAAITGSPSEREADREAEQVPPSVETARANPSTRRSVETPDPGLIRVVDADGDPVSGIGVALFGGEVVVAPPRGIPPKLLGTTDADGRMRPELEGLGEVPKPWHVYLVDFVSKEPLSQPFDPGADSETMFRLPPTGVVEVQVVEDDGSLTKDELEVELTLVSTEELAQPELVFERRGWNGVLADGRATFEWVALGQTLQAKVGPKDSQVRARSDTGGPVVPAERIVLQTKRGAAHPILGYRAVHEDGRLLANVTLQGVRDSLFEANKSLVVHTDSQGHFRLDGTTTFLFGHWTRFTCEWDGVRLTGGTPDDKTRESGYQFLGDVIFRPPGVLASGRVVDRDGRPAEAWTVTLSGGGSHDFRGRPRQHAEAQSKEDGTFVLEGDPEREEFEISATYVGRTTGSRTVARGARGIELRERLNVKLHVKVLLDEGLLLEPVELELWADGSHVAGQQSRDGDANFTMGPVEEGSYDLLCRYGSAEVARIRDLWIGEDASSTSVDLTGKLRTHSVRVTGAEETPSGHLYWRVSDSDDRWSKLAFEDSRVEFAAPAPVVDVRVVVEGYRIAELVGLSGAGTVELRALLRVRIVLVTDGPIPGPPYVFDPNLNYDNLDVGTAIDSPFLSDSKREAVFDCAVAGPVRISWHFEKRVENGAIGSHVLRDHEATIDVLDHPGEQRFEVHVPAKAFERLVSSPPF